MMDLSGFLLLLAPFLGAIIVLRPSWSEFFFLIFPLLAVNFAVVFSLRFAIFIGLGLVGLLILLCTINIDAEERGIIAAPVTPGLLDRLLRARENATASERARRRNSLMTQSRHLTLARVIGVECVILSLIAAFVLV
jgi:hypothetical protein